MLRIFSIVSILTLLLLGFNLTGCGSSGTASKQEETIKIGLISPLTGGAADYGRLEKDGATLAVEEINASGGVLGKKLQLIPEDDGTTPEGGVNGVRRLLDQEQVKIVVGSSNSSIAIAEKEITRDRVLHIVTAAQSNAITKEGHKWLLDGNPTVTDYARGLNKLVLEKLKPKRIAVFVENTEYGQDNLNLLKEMVKDSGAEIVATVWHTQKDADFTSALTQIKSSNPDMIFTFNAAPQLMPQIYKQMSELGMKDITKVHSAGTVTTKAIEAAGGAMEGLYTADLWHPDVNNQMSKAFRDAYKERFGYTPEKVAALAYMDIKIAAEAIKEAGSYTEYDKIVQIIKGKKWPSMLTGDMEFDQEGRNHTPPILLRVANNQLKIAE